MTKNLRTVILIVVVILASFGLSKFILSLKKEAEDVTPISYDKLVEVQKVALGINYGQVSINGRVQAIEKLALFSQVSGTLLNNSFKEGLYHKKGDRLIQMNDLEFNHLLKAKKSSFISLIASVMGDITSDFPDELGTWESFLRQVKVDVKLPPLPKIENVKLKTFLSGKNLLNSYYSILSQEETLTKYSIVAPFDGVVTMSTVNQGTLIRQGQKLGEFINPNQFEFVTEVSLSDLQFLGKGQSVKLYSEDFERTWKGQVHRVNEQIENNSQRIKVYIKMSGQGLKEGMYLQGNITSKAFDGSVCIARSQIEDGHVLIVEKGKVIRKKVSVLYVSDNRAVLRGVEQGDLLISSSLKGLYEGIPVKIK